MLPAENTGSTSLAKIWQHISQRKCIQHHYWNICNCYRLTACCWRHKLERTVPYVFFVRKSACFFKVKRYYVSFIGAILAILSHSFNVFLDKCWSASTQHALVKLHSKNVLLNLCIKFAILSLHICLVFDKTSTFYT